MLCEITGLGQIRCQSVAEVLALFEPKFGITLINDIIRAEKLFSDDKSDTLLDCGFGILAAVDSGSDISSIAGSWGVLDNRKKTLFLEACAEAGQGRGASSGGGGPAGGFSGISARSGHDTKSQKFHRPQPSSPPGVAPGSERAHRRA